MADEILLLSGLQPTGRVSFGAVRDGQEITQELNFTVNDAPDEQSWLDNGDIAIENVAMYYDAVVLVDGEPAAEIYEWEPAYELETRELRLGGGDGQKGERGAGYKVVFSMTQYKIKSSRLFQRVVQAVRARRPLEGVVIQCVYRGVEV